MYCNVSAPGVLQLALNAGLCFFLVCFMSCSSTSVILGAELSLSQLSSFWGPPQHVSAAGATFMLLEAWQAKHYKVVNKERKERR